MIVKEIGIIVKKSAGLELITKTPPKQVKASTGPLWQQECPLAEIKPPTKNAESYSRPLMSMEMVSCLLLKLIKESGTFWPYPNYLT
jgi:hypothetical protein